MTLAGSAESAGAFWPIAAPHLAQAAGRIDGFPESWRAPPRGMRRAAT